MVQKNAGFFVLYRHGRFPSGMETETHCVARCIEARRLLREHNSLAHSDLLTAARRSLLLLRHARLASAVRAAQAEAATPPSEAAVLKLFRLYVEFATVNAQWSLRDDGNGSWVAFEAETRDELRVYTTTQPLRGYVAGDLTVRAHDLQREYFMLNLCHSSLSEWSLRN